MKQKLCLFTDSLEPSGVGEQMLCFAAELRRNFEISFVCPPTAAGVRLLERAAGLGAQVLGLRVRGAYSTRARLADWLARAHIDIFHCHAGIAWEGHHAVLAARTAGVPLILRTEHLPYIIQDDKQAADYRQALEAVDHVTCVSEGVGQTFLRAGVPAAKLSIIRNGIHPHRAQPDRARLVSELGLEPDADLVLTVGRMTPQKGHIFLLVAIPWIRAFRPQAHFFWIGDGPLRQELAAQARDRGVADAVHLLGKRDDVSTWMASSDLLVLPSLFEGMPLAILEAMANGLPVIGTRACGMTEQIVDGVSGRLVQPGDPKGLAEAIVEGLLKPERAARWAAAARMRFESEFHASRMANEMRSLYLGLMAQKMAEISPSPTRSVLLGLDSSQTASSAVAMASGE